MAQLERLRALRKRANALHTYIEADFKGFLANDQLTFVWDPSTGKDSVSTATTCTGLMALASTKSLSKIYGDAYKERAREAFKLVLGAPWDSSGLKKDNAFTTILVLRTAATLASASVIDHDELASMKRSHEGRWNGKELRHIASKLIARFPESIRIDKYPPTSAVGYWLVDALSNLKVDVDARQLQALAKWTRDQFVRQASLIVSGHDALMDPIAFAMSAALTWRFSGPRKPGGAYEFRNDLPTDIEVEQGVREFVTRQLPGGLWPKYFPLFHFKDAGANYCWSFEVLEALLLELLDDNRLSDPEPFIVAIEKAVTWCERNRLEVEGRKPRSGWNSGTDIAALGAGLPELWPTAVVHMFANRTVEYLEQLIQTAIERKYDAQQITGAEWDPIVDYDLNLVGIKEPTTVKVELETFLIQPIIKGAPSRAKSALIFGPPGTSKTSLVKAVAQRLGWKYVELTPNEFLRNGLANIYITANEIFDDLKDLTRVVILFDEMDALTRTREQGKEQPLDVTQQFLTTSMLPKLAQLHDQRDIVFFMATNYQENFDPAIKRPGRFDLLLLLGPPAWKRKVDALETFWRRVAAPPSPNEVEEAQVLLRSWVPESSKCANQLDLFTFNDLTAFFRDVISESGDSSNGLLTALKSVGPDAFKRKAAEWYSDYIALRPGNSDAEPSKQLTEYDRYQRDLKVSRRQM